MRKSTRSAGEEVNSPCKQDMREERCGECVYKFYDLKGGTNPRDTVSSNENFNLDSFAFLQR